LKKPCALLVKQFIKPSALDEADQMSTSSRPHDPISCCVYYYNAGYSARANTLASYAEMNRQARAILFFNILNFCAIDMQRRVPAFHPYRAHPCQGRNQLKNSGGHRLHGRRRLAHRRAMLGEKVGHRQALHHRQERQDQQCDSDGPRHRAGQVSYSFNSLLTCVSLYLQLQTGGRDRLQQLVHPGERQPQGLQHWLLVHGPERWFVGPKQALCIDLFISAVLKNETLKSV